VDPTTILFIVLGVAIVIYIIAMIEALTRNSDQKPGSQFKKEKKKEPQKEKEKEKTWPPKEESE
jgi:flagellar basal body-associated protein FliL